MRDIEKIKMKKNWLGSARIKKNLKQPCLMRSPEKRVPNYFDANISHEKEDEGGLILLTRILEFFSSSHFLLSLEQNPIHVKKITAGGR